MVVFGLGKDLLFKSVVGHSDLVKFKKKFGDFAKQYSHMYLYYTDC